MVIKTFEDIAEYIGKYQTAYENLVQELLTAINAGIDVDGNIPVSLVMEILNRSLNEVRTLHRGN